ncbi:hypothetical protein DFP72DRAFT_936124, partial [Ephemerocybe angulata]
EEALGLHAEDQRWQSSSEIMGRRVIQPRRVVVAQPRILPWQTRRSDPVLQYLARIEQIALHLGTGVLKTFVSCAQVKVTGSGTGNPAKISIPSYIAANGTPLLLPSLASVSSASSDALVSTSPGEGLKRVIPRWRRARRGGWGLRGSG